MSTVKYQKAAATADLVREVALRLRSGRQWPALFGFGHEAEHDDAERDKRSCSVCEKSTGQP